MTHPPYLRDKARQMRVEKRLTLDEIAERLALPKTTVWSWISDLSAPPRRSSPGQKLGNEAMQRKYRLLREAAYERGRAEFATLSEQRTFRDFVVLYIAEGYKRNRNVVSVANRVRRRHRGCGLLDPATAARKVTYSLQYHVDQDLDEIRAAWADVLCIDPDSIRLLRKSNSNQLTGRTWRSEFGVLTITVAHGCKAGSIAFRTSGSTLRPASGCSEAWYRAAFGERRPPVQIRAPRPRRFGNEPP